MAYNRYKRFAANKKLGNLKPPFCEFNPHDKEYDSPVMRTDNMLITSIDPGIVNCGVYVSCHNTKKKTHESLFLSRLSFNKENNHYEESIRQLNELEKKYKYFSNSHYIVIESQMTISYDNTRMCQHLITYFMSTLRNQGSRPIIIEITSQAKTKLLECPRGLSKYQYKKWCVQKAIKYLEERENDKEEPFVDKIKSSKKKDEYGDTICQYYAWMKILDGEALQPTLPTRR